MQPEIHIYRHNLAWWAMSHTQGGDTTFNKVDDLNPDLNSFKVLEKIRKHRKFHFPEIPLENITVNGISVGAPLPKKDKTVKIKTKDLFRFCKSQADIVGLLNERSPFSGEYTPYANKAVEHIIVRIYQMQTQDERSARKTKHTNGVGFSSAHARLGSYYARWILGKIGPNPEGNRLSGYHLKKARTMAEKYRKQMFALLLRLRALDEAA